MGIKETGNRIKGADNKIEGTDNRIAGKKAAAIAYTPPMAAPLVLARGKDREAERIISAAREAGIAIVEDPGLAAMLQAVKPGDYVPPWCWEIAAKILAFVFEKEKDEKSRR